ncbi:hypothetical protein E0W68_09480 [Flavobacterium salilacus subsp. salilacus]|uniref:hypothetical protein n=1 Tax=Flavobacterium TaxID=237 RepID=UPI001074AC2D|nr:MULTISPECIES: hypothetical protein [Flavobacterium]KAF2518245.1 hypothetical protein E0W68_09480 [Flavobacterium salilacus subsp. salilacus]MBE1615345.1 hypothetical protein [Flavobacterium sp. SaA2.13]
MIYTIYNTENNRVAWCEDIISPENLNARLEEIGSPYAASEHLCTEKFYIAKINPETGEFSEDATPEEIASVEIEE